MANTVIQLKFSTATATPSSLNVAEPAYSYTSNTLFIGTPAGTGSIAIGGKFFLDQQASIFNLVNSAFTTANAAGSSIFAQAAFVQANAAFDSANSAATLQSGINATQNTNITNAQNTGDAAFLAANSAATISAATDLTQNNSITAAFLAGNTAATLQAGINATQNTNITDVTNTAAAAFTTANNALAKTGGGTITGDLVITGNLTTSGTRTYANTTNVQLGDNIITLNAEIPSGLAPTENAGFEVNRGSSANVSLVWNEANDNWVATNDGSYFYVLADAAVDATQNTNITTVTNTATAAFLAANTAATLSAATDATQNTNITNAQNTADAAFLTANSAATLSAATDLTQNNSITAAFLAANTAATLSAATDATQNNSIAAAFAQANTDFTNISISSADHGSASAVAAFRVAANGRIVSANSTSIAIDTAAITSGTLGVTRGGTGAATHTNNGVLLGQGTSALTTASSSTEGHVLTINNSGVPTFSHLSGGTF